MDQKSKKQSRRFFNISVAAARAAAIAATALMAGCAGSGEEEKETRVVTETQVVTRVVNGIFTDEEGNPIKDENGQPVSAPSGTPDTDDKSKSGKSDSKSDGSSNADGSEKSEKSEKSEQDEKSESSKSDGGSESKGSDSGSKSESSKSDDSKKTPEKKDDDGDDSNNLKLGGKSYEVGDVIVCTYSVNCPTKFINFQATLKYDGDKLKAINAETAGSASSGSVVNYDLDSKVKFNGIKLNGYNYAKGGEFLTVTYKVLDSGSADPKISWEIVTDTTNNPMIVNGEPVSDFKVEEKYE